MRMNYYPPCPQTEDVIGLNTHSDAEAITILLQVTENNGIYRRSIEHLATVNSENKRISIATFHRPEMNKIIRPTPSLVTILKVLQCLKALD
ncbi:hypothetical protein HN51_069958 [Arachis hypogaea]|uniref:Isopenicillin N synthase-like Fe(2+) 2OG dioxygenase domain-containing protein n=1 Tax=Arachis hypogaea TaxID=3818 RepID=A0A444Z3U9_ARAHY|nr:hypothetical protein Ahy_B05g076743 [Arachis hypogaea]